MAKYRKRPVVIEAVQITEPMTVETLEGTMRGEPGDWLITGVKGERYFCKDDIFRQTYEPADARPAVAGLDVRPEVAWFAEQMEKRLRENDHKGGWKHERGWWLLLRAQEEMGELIRAFLAGDRQAVRRECADVGNFVMMLADITAADRSRARVGVMPDDARTKVAEVIEACVEGWFCEDCNGIRCTPPDTTCKIDHLLDKRLKDLADAVVEAIEGDGPDA